MNNDLSYMSNFLVEVKRELGSNVDIKDGRAVFPSNKYPIIKKIIMDDGYEDPLVVDFSPSHINVMFELDQFGIETTKPKDAAALFTSFISGLLDGNFKLNYWEMPGITVYQATVAGKSFNSVKRDKAIGYFIPGFFVKRFTTKQSLSPEAG